ncbi:hypothetical protein EDB81DRAFT_294468 [Dactylonectria macrodidyma]|uniref:Uncharacterized protein n=1 Tax=Dactylonectria macrodidyma TaxID=307937 RepID=A0A9P9D8Z8_9HYPO|nr:hypothetical protein EDB81DRAFT_294468 [Dactylonectria macrodidyma]
MPGHGAHELARQGVQVAADHLLLVPAACPADLVLADPLQLGCLGPRAPASVRLLPRGDACIRKRLDDPVPLRVVREGCRMVAPAPAPSDQPRIVPRRPPAEVWKRLVGGYIPPVEEVERKASQHTDKRVLIPEGPGCLKAAMLVLLPCPCCKDQGHAAGRALPLELEGKEVRDLGRAAVAPPGSAYSARAADPRESASGTREPCCYGPTARGRRVRIPAPCTHRGGYHGPCRHS